MNLVWLVLFLPLLGSLINGLFGRHLPKGLVGWLACGSVGLAFLISVRILFDLLALPPDQRLFTQTLFDWISVGELSTQISLLVDPLSTLMILVVTGVGFLIHVYSMGYMDHDSD